MGAALVLALVCAACGAGAGHPAASGPTTALTAGATNLRLRGGGNLAVVELDLAPQHGFGLSLLAREPAGGTVALMIAAPGEVATPLKRIVRLTSGLVVYWAAVPSEGPQRWTINSPEGVGHVTVFGFLSPQGGEHGMGWATTPDRPTPGPLRLLVASQSQQVWMVYGDTISALPGTGGTSLVLDTGGHQVAAAGIADAGQGRFVAYFPPTSAGPGAAFDYLAQGRTVSSWPLSPPG